MPAQNTLSLRRPIWGPRRWLGLAIAVAGAVVLALQFTQFLQANPRVAQAWQGGLVAALATALGTLPVVFSQRLSERVQDTLFGFGAGVMLAASSFSLIIPGLEAAKTNGAGSWAAGGIVGASILLGGLALLAMERVLPHEHFIKGVEGGPSPRTLRRTWLFVFAIALHNLPEGLAIGVAYGGASPLQAGTLTAGIAIQDVPEGLVVAMALLAAGYRRWLAVLLGMASGLVEPLGAVLGASVIGLSAGLLPWGLGFAAGAMLFVISHEIIPESHRKGHESWATGGLMIGFVLMMLLDTALG
ncbi:ZIP family metal transporter [Paracidovorax citrulli]|uniref:Zinc/iron permease n=2 Tax=Paracidovorax citrulli TaxID=80869 RepID=A1TQJ7_PARC0|nr:ZIP family metal transporter [Paracidovorax citrulli]ABM33235.1 zinc/iron permease [Paracidovorax citrulli AAC00-1]ATG92839.1 ZIP family metal transporter [Paracidovorax citrulli]MVT28947.1 ZIP family metal transporter [Paracidovorax citrulli]PVY67465.1 ZIP family zinc transporter [Paracidovorax citrulli]QCX13045.1 Zinc transporter ZupT [Paracidovorax citrulli]